MASRKPGARGTDAVTRLSRFLSREDADVIQKKGVPSAVGIACKVSVKRKIYRGCQKAKERGATTREATAEQKDYGSKIIS